MRQACWNLCCAALVMLSVAGCGGGNKSSTSSTNGTNATSDTMQGAMHGRRHRGGGMEAGMTSEAGPPPNCGAVRAVWVNTRSHVYHEAGDPYYGRTKNGKWECPRQARAEGDRPAGAGASHRSTTSGEGSTSQ